MRIPFLRKRERNPVLYNKGIEDEYELNRKARSYITKLFLINFSMPGKKIRLLTVNQSKILKVLIVFIMKFIESLFENPLYANNLCN